MCRDIADWNCGGAERTCFTSGTLLCFQVGLSLRLTFYSSSPHLPISLALLLVDPSSGVIYSRNRGSASFVMLFFLATFSQFPLFTDDSQASGVTQAFSHLLSFPSFSLPLSLSLHIFGVMDPSSHDSAWHLNVLSVMLLPLAFIFSIYFYFPTRQHAALMTGSVVQSIKCHKAITQMVFTVSQNPKWTFFVQECF